MSDTVSWRNKKLVSLLGFLAVINLGFLAWFAFGLYEQDQDRQLNFNSRKTEIAQEFSQKIEQKLLPLMDIAEDLAADLAAGKLDSTALIKRMQEDAAKFNYIDGLFVAFDPYGFTTDKEFFLPLLVKEENGHELIILDYDYTANPWYKQPFSEGATWAEPFFGKASGDLLIQYGVPIWGEGQVPLGVVAINMSPDELNKIVSSSLPTATEGFGFVLSPQGNYYYHPIGRLVLEKKSISDLLAATNHADRTRLIDTVFDGKRVMIETQDELVDRKAILFFEPVSLSNWTVGLHYFKTGEAHSYRLNSEKKIWLMLGIFFEVILLLILLIQYYSGNLKVYWTASIITSLMFMGGIYFIWTRALLTPFMGELQEDNLVIVNEAVLENFMEQQSEIAQKTKKEVVYIPTGIFVQQLQFVNSYNVMVSGYVWQIYDKEKTTYRDGEPISQGFVFAETEPNAEVLSIEEAYRKDLGDKEVVGWYFRVSLREEFEYRHYPFDQQRIWLRLWHQDFHRKVVLIPDLASYKLIDPVSLPGLETDFVLPNWDLRASFFDYHFNSYNSSFGIAEKFSSEARPELYFNIVAQRKFNSPFITNIVPLFVVALLLFSVLMTSKKNANELLGFSGFGVVEACGAFFFVVIISQTQVRESLEVSETIYLDYFYFTMYLMLTIVTIISILFTRRDPLKFISYEDNIIAKMAYWPLLLGTLLVITNFVFY